MRRAKKIILVIAALLVLGAALIVRPWHMDKITIMSPVLQKNITVNGRLLRSTGTIKVWVPGHDEKRQQTKNDTTIIINQWVPAQMLYFPQETVGLVVVEYESECSMSKKQPKPEPKPEQRPICRPPVGRLMIPKLPSK